MRMCVCYLSSHEAGLCCCLVMHMENLLRQLQLFYFHLWPMYWLSLVCTKQGLKWANANQNYIHPKMYKMEKYTKFYYNSFTNSEDIHLTHGQMGGHSSVCQLSSILRAHNNLYTITFHIDCPLTSLRVRHTLKSQPYRRKFLCVQHMGVSVRIVCWKRNLVML
jgi:hypothetical protein